MNKKDMCEMYDEMIAKENGYKQGAKDENKKRIEQLKCIRNEIEKLLKNFPETVVYIQLINLSNKIRSMENEI